MPYEMDHLLLLGETKDGFVVGEVDDAISFTTLVESRPTTLYLGADDARRLAKSLNHFSDVLTKNADKSS